MERRGASAERRAVAAFLVVVAVALALVVVDATSDLGLAPAPLSSPAAPAVLAPAWALVPESAPWRLTSDSLPPRRIALLNVGDGAARPPAPTLAEGGRFFINDSDCRRVVRPGRGCLVLLDADPVEDGRDAARASGTRGGGRLRPDRGRGRRLLGAGPPQGRAGPPGV